MSNEHLNVLPTMQEAYPHRCRMSDRQEATAIELERAIKIAIRRCLEQQRLPDDIVEYFPESFAHTHHIDIRGLAYRVWENVDG